MFICPAESAQNLRMCKSYMQLLIMLHSHSLIPRPACIRSGNEPGTHTHLYLKVAGILWVNGFNISIAHRDACKGEQVTEYHMYDIYTR